MHGDPEAEKFVSQGVEKQGLEHVNGIALSPNCGCNRTLYYMPQSSFHIFSISTSVLKDEKLASKYLYLYHE